MRITSLFLAIAAMVAGVAACEERPPQSDVFSAESSGVVLMYHHVDRDTPPITSIAPERFTEQLDYLAANGFEIWPLDKLVDHVKRGQPTPDKTVAITFDDAYVSIYDTAFPQLKARGWPFTIFVATELVGTNDSQYLTWEQLREMQAAGATIASHTHTHAHLVRQQEGENQTAYLSRIREEIRTALELIEENTGSTSDLFAYPYGEYTGPVAKTVSTLRLTGFGQQSGALGMTSRFDALPRFPMGGPYTAMEPFKTKVATLPLPIKEIRRDPILSGDFRPKLTLEFIQDDLRFEDLVCYGPGGDKIELGQTGPTTFVAQSRTDVPVGRSRYNCTMPVADGSRFYWFSQIWIRKRDDGTWYPEP